MSEPKKYIIKTLSDFLDVPADRLHRCIADFEHGLKEAQSRNEPTMKIHDYEWTDDGVEGGDVVITADPTPDCGRNAHEKALRDLIPFVLEDYYSDYATPEYKAAVEQAKIVLGMKNEKEPT